MTKWIELREKIRKIYGKHNRLILAVVKFILALFLFLLINHYVGYMEKLHHVYIAVALALICAMLPVNMTVLLAAVFTVVHLYALSMEVAVTALLIFLLMFFLYFRFSPKNGYDADHVCLSDSICGTGSEWTHWGTVFDDLCHIWNHSLLFFKWNTQ